MLKWGVIGVGRAGRARAAAIAADPRSEAIFGYRGKVAEAGLAEAPSVDALLSAVDAVAICTPDDTHPALVRRAIDAGCHVLCEYPLAPTAAEAAELLAFADARGVVLHVEHIELLGAAAAWWRQQRLGRIHSGRLVFQSGRLDVSVVDGCLARLHRIIDILGPPLASWVSQRSHSALKGQLRWHELTVLFDFTSREGLRRSTLIALECDRGRCSQVDRDIFFNARQVTLPPTPGLFDTDQRAATAAILDGAPHYLSRDRLLRALSLRDALRSGEPGRWQVLLPPG